MRDVSTPLDMTKELFAKLEVRHDVAPRSAAMNMAIDEVLLDTSKFPTIRFYRWDHDALSFGYFGRFADVESFGRERDLVRRWTGGGIVFHGEDLTYSMVIPASDPRFLESSTSIYEKVHRAIADVLIDLGQSAVVAAGVRRDALPRVQDSPRRVPAASSGGNCFANPVRADVMLNGQKIAGAAQRRTKRGLLQQGSIQLAAGRVRPTGGFVDIENGLAERFAQTLSANVATKQIDGHVIERAEEIAAKKYATEAWLRKR